MQLKSLYSHILCVSRNDACSTAAASCCATTFFSVDFSTWTLTDRHRHYTVGNLPPWTPTSVHADAITVGKQAWCSNPKRMGAWQLPSLSFCRRRRQLRQCKDDAHKERRKSSKEMWSHGSLDLKQNSLVSCLVPCSIYSLFLFTRQRNR